jgi:uncharacterized Ntn-hydrolase superfamily protein
MTFSIVARDPATGDLGCAVQSRFLAVGAAVPWARAGVGVVATQAHANLTYGPRGLALLEAGASPAVVIDTLVGSDELAAARQVGVLDAAGHVAVHTGSDCHDWAGHVMGSGFSCQGNLLASAAVVESMAEILSDRGNLPFPERLVTALRAGQAAGGDLRGQQSAGLLVVRPGGGYGGGSDRYVDLRVDDHAAPIEELARLLALHRLYFERPRDDELLPIDTELRREIAGRLSGAAGGPIDANDPDQVWARLEAWAGRENLEERLVRPGTIDRTVLRILREQTDEAGTGTSTTD